MKNKSYIGDGCYVYWDAPNLWIEAGERNRVAINADNFGGLMDYVRTHKDILNDCNPEVTICEVASDEVDRVVQYCEKTLEPIKLQG